MLLIARVDLWLISLEGGQSNRGPASALPSGKKSLSEKKNPCKPSFEHPLPLNAPNFKHIGSHILSAKTSSSSGSGSTAESSVFSIPLPVFDVPNPPGLIVNPTSWADDVDAGLFPDVLISNAQSTLPPLSSNAAAPQSVRHHKVDDGRYLEDAFAELGVADPMEDYANTWEVEAVQSVKGTTPPAQPSVSETNLWDNWDAPQPVEPEMLCTDHGKICKKGICKTYHKQLKDAERAKKQIIWDQEEAERAKKGKGKGKGKRGGGQGK